MAGKLCLTFDDDYIAPWMDAAMMFQEFGAVGTFMVSGFHRLTPQKVGALQQMQAVGNEIGLHSLTHCDFRLLEGFTSPQQYIRQEVIPPLMQMRASGLGVRAWAWPFNYGSPELVSEMASLFCVQRRAAPTPEDALHQGGEAVLYGYSADLVVHNKPRTDRTLEDLLALLALADTQDKTLVLYMHSVAVSGPLAIPPVALKALLTDASRRNMRFVTASAVAENRP